MMIRSSSCKYREYHYPCVNKYERSQIRIRRKYGKSLALNKRKIRFETKAIEYEYR